MPVEPPNVGGLRGPTVGNLHSRPVSKRMEVAMGFELWKTLGISWQVGIGAMVSGVMAATLVALLVSRRRARASAVAGRLDLSRPD
jgi:ABC-type spermidine/putrescine transport system permease subunit II